MKSDDAFSFVVWYWQDARAAVASQPSPARLRVVWVDTGSEVSMKDATFLVRVYSESSSSGEITRCLIRHIASGREVYLQSGANLQAFVRDCLLVSSDDSSSVPPNSETQG